MKFRFIFQPYIMFDQYKYRNSVKYEGGFMRNDNFNYATFKYGSIKIIKITEKTNNIFIDICSQCHYIS